MSAAVIRGSSAKVRLSARPAVGRSRAGRTRAIRGLGRYAAGLCAAGGLGVFAVWGFAHALPHATMAGGGLADAVPPAPRPMWIDIPRPIRLWSLQSPDLAELPLVYTARRRSIGAGREDSLRFGALGVDEPALSLRVFRRDAGDRTAAAPLYVALARQAADAGLAIERSGLPDLLPTRYGKFEVSSLVLTGGATAALLACSGFRLVLDQPALTIAGLACGRAGAAMPQATLGCLLDRLDLASAGEDRALVDFVAASELRRTPECAGMRLGPDEAHAAWLDDRPATPRKSLRRRRGIPATAVAM